MWSFLAPAAPEIGLTQTILNRPGVLVAVIIGTIVLGALAWLLANSLGWNRWAAVLAAAGLALALSVTLVRPGGHLPHRADNPLYLCIHDSFSLHGGLQLLNFAMLMPLALFGALATRRPISTAVGCALLSAGIEVTQALTGLGICQKQDFLNNTIGAIVAVVIAWALLIVSGTNGPGRGHRDRHHTGAGTLAA
ncbi:MAG TPA: VanZ family protein [Pseudonocardiaceae bacterium]|jgi:VanZ family protein|nr:VanZ family protein [Pseudonocardiaceae bacterium]